MPGPAQVFYPSLVINFKLRFDEALTVVTNVKPPLSVDDAINSVQIPGNPTTEPLVLKKGVKNASFLFNRVPKRCSVELPGYRQAGTFSCDIDYRELPIDPRTVRAAAVEIHLGTVSNADFGRGVTQVNPDGTRTSYLQTRTANGLVNQETLLMVGMVDEWSAEHDESGSVVSLKGRDLRGILLDTPCSADVSNVDSFFQSIDTDEPIDDVVKDILALHPAFAEISVVVNPSEWPDGIVPAPWSKDLTPRHRHGAKGKATVPKKTPPSEMGKVNFWDLIVRMCYLVGAIPYFQGAELYIRPARSIFDQGNAGTALNPAPFLRGRPRAVDASTGQAIVPPLKYRRLVYGRDLRSLSFDRKFGGYQRPKVIRVVSVDASSRERGDNRLNTAVWPPGALAVPNAGVVQTKGVSTRIGAGGEANQEEVMNIPVTGVRDPTRLQDIARGVYEEIGRGEVGGSATTVITSFGGTNDDPDMLRLRPGQGVDFYVDTRSLSVQSPLVSLLTDTMRTPFEKQVTEVRKRLNDENLARVIVATSRGAVQQLQRFFRVSTAKYDWSEKGVKIDFDFQNYIVVRDQYDDNGQQGVPTAYPQGTKQVTAVPSKAKS